MGNLDWYYLEGSIERLSLGKTLIFLNDELRSYELNTGNWPTIPKEFSRLGILRVPMVYLLSSIWVQFWSMKSHYLMWSLGISWFLKHLV
jgi:hypothetical protein